MTYNHTSTQSVVSPPTSTLQDLNEIASLFDTGMYTKEVCRVARVVRLTVGLRRKLTGSVISSFLDFALVPSSEAHTRLFLMLRLLNMTWKLIHHHRLLKLLLSIYMLSSRFTATSLFFFFSLIRKSTTRPKFVLQLPLVASKVLRGELLMALLQICIFTTI